MEGRESDDVIARYSVWFWMKQFVIQNSGYMNGFVKTDEFLITNSWEESPYFSDEYYCHTFLYTSKGLMLASLTSSQRRPQKIISLTSIVRLDSTTCASSGPTFLPNFIDPPTIYLRCMLILLALYLMFVISLHTYKQEPSGKKE